VAAHPGLIHLDVLIEQAADTTLVGTHHGRAEFVENAERGLIA